MKKSFNTNLFTYVLIRVLLSTTVACLVMAGAYFITYDLRVMLVLSIPIVIIICLYTAMIIARHAKDLVDEPLNKVVEFANILRKASHTLIETANSLNQKADAIQGAADMLDDFSDSNITEQEN